MTYHDDNFGEYDIRDEGDIEFYNQVQDESVWKRCQGCARIVKLRPDYVLCNTCATMLERGGDLDPPEILNAKIDLELQLHITREKVEKAIRDQKKEEDQEDQEDQEERDG